MKFIMGGKVKISIKELDTFTIWPVLFFKGTKEFWTIKTHLYVKNKILKFRLFHSIVQRYISYDANYIIYSLSLKVNIILNELTKSLVSTLALNFNMFVFHKALTGVKLKLFYTTLRNKKFQTYLTKTRLSTVHHTDTDTAEIREQPFRIISWSLKNDTREPKSTGDTDNANFLIKFW